MSALEKFGILVILVLVVIIGMVAVWGVGTPAGETPFGDGGTDVATVPDPGAGADRLPEWPAPAVPAEGTASAPPAVVPPPSVERAPMPPVAVTPPSVPVTPSPAVPAARRTWTVRSGDTLAGIAKKELGDASLWKKILDANPGLDPKRLRVGSTINLPDGAGGVAASALSPEPAPAPRAAVSTFLPNPADGPTAPHAADPAPAAGEEYVIRAGDTLSRIAADRLGNSALWYRILEENAGLDPKRLTVGRTIRLPAAR